MTITCDTPIDALISLDDISPVLSSVENEIYSYVSTITRTIEQEQAGGGLSTDAYYVNDSADLNNMGNDLISGMTFSSTFSSNKDQIISALERQRKKELQTLLDAVTEKMIHLKAEYRYLSSKVENALVGEDVSSYKSRMNEIETAFYQKYKPKRDTLKGMI